MSAPAIDISLPNELNYTKKPDPLPQNTTNTQNVITPNNGSVFGASSYIQLELPVQDFLDGGTLYARYQSVIGNGTGTSNIMFGTPAVTPFTRMEMSINGTTYESIPNYNIIYDKWVNYQMNYAQKAGATNLGYVQPTIGNTAAASAISSVEVNGSPAFPPSTTTVFNVGFNFMSMLSTCDALVPLCVMPKVVIRLYTDTLANMFNNVAPTTGVLNYSIQNFQLVYDSISFGHGVEQLVRTMSPKLLLKTQSWSSLTNTLNSGSSGNRSLPFNMYFKSIKSIFSYFQPDNATNKIFDSVDPTTNNGNYAYWVGGKSYPTQVIDTFNNRAGIMMELKQAVNGSINTVQAQNMSITTTEISYTDTGSTSVRQPGKFVFASNTERLQTKDAFLTGISSFSTAINLNVAMNTAITRSYTVYMYVLYDVIIEIDSATGSVTVVQ